MDQQSTLDPNQAYRALLEAGSLKPDPSQAQAMNRLQDLHEQLRGYAPQMGGTGRMARLKLGRNKLLTPRGVYLWGGVGRGKSMLMDLFFESTTIKDRKRVYFHAFMLEVHKRMHSYREAVKAGKGEGNHRPPGGALTRDLGPGLAALFRLIPRH